MWLSSRARIVVHAVALATLVASPVTPQRAVDLESIGASAPPPPPLAPSTTRSILLSQTPSWTSGDVTRVSTGGALADIDGDLDLDFVVSNGNDASEDPQVVYRNLGTGLEVMPSWTSTDSQYSGHCAVGDVDGDGAPEFVVANYGSFEPQRVILYRNLGMGFENSASWQTSDLDNSFSLALGDVDLDGDLDLAVANGDAYVTGPAPNDLYLNHEGVLDTSPAWITTEVESSYDVAWADVDMDGDLDLAAINSQAPVRLYDNQDGVLGATAVWSSTIAPNGNTLAFGDVNGDGYLDLAVATNRQHTGFGCYHVFENHAGVLEASPSWTSDVGNVYGSAVAFADLDADGDEDLIAGSWWGQMFVFENQAGVLTTQAAWFAQTPSVIEAIVPGDLDGDGLQQRSDIMPGDGARRLFYVSRRPIQWLIQLRVDGLPLAPGTYAIDLDAGWISVATAPQHELAVDYMVSDDLDVAVTNFRNYDGNFVLDNERPTTGVAAVGSLAPTVPWRLSPTPVRTNEWLTISEAPAGTEVRVFSLSGRLSARLRTSHDGKARYRPDQPGILLLQVAGTHSPTRKLVVLP